MTGEDNVGYLAKRASEEKARSKRALNKQAAAMHAEMARRYDELASHGAIHNDWQARH